MVNTSNTQNRYVNPRNRINFTYQLEGFTAGDIYPIKINSLVCSQFINSISVENLQKYQAIAIPLIKTGSSMGMEGLTFPLRTVLLNSTFKKKSFKDSCKLVLKSPFNGLSSQMKLSLTNYGSIFGFHKLFDSALINMGVNKEDAHSMAYFPASIVTTVGSTPLDTKALSARMNLPQIKTVRGMFRGVIPTIQMNLAKWGLGLLMGDKINAMANPNNNDNLGTKLASKCVGWTMGNAVSSPFYHIAKTMKINPELKTMGHVLKSKKYKVLFDETKYNPEKQIISSKLARLVYGMPLTLKHQPALHSKQKIRLFINQAVANFPSLWKNYTKSLPLVLLTGGIVGLVEHIAKKSIEN